MTLPPAAHAATFDLTGSCPGGVGDVVALLSAIKAANSNNGLPAIISEIAIVRRTTSLSCSR